MVRRIIWSSKADKVFTAILEFYVERNGTKTYSRKLNAEVIATINLLKKNPFLGVKCEFENIRVLILKHYKIFYQIETEDIIIHLVWDNRQNPDKIVKFL